MIYELLNQYKLKYLYQWAYLKIKNILLDINNILESILTLYF